jgi:hypothetical protein
MRRIRIWLGAALVLALPVAAAADTRTVEDERSPQQAVDPVAASHGHDDLNGVLVHTVTMDRPWQEGDLRGVTLDVWLPETGKGIDRRVTVGANPDGSMYGLVSNAAGRITGHANVWMPDDRSIRIEVSRLLFGRRTDAYRWRVTVAMECTGQGDEPCMPQRDRVPDRGRVLHEL